MSLDMPLCKRNVTPCRHQTNLYKNFVSSYKSAEESTKTLNLNNKHFENP
jgi:hypothetical protein